MTSKYFYMFQLVYPHLSLRMIVFSFILECSTHSRQMKYHLWSEVLISQCVCVEGTGYIRGIELPTICKHGNATFNVTSSQ